jgi:hypothetical protein
MELLFQILEAVARIISREYLPLVYTCTYVRSVGEIGNSGGEPAINLIAPNALFRFATAFVGAGAKEARGSHARGEQRLRLAFFDVRTKSSASLRHEIITYLFFFHVYQISRSSRDS